MWFFITGYRRFKSSLKDLVSPAHLVGGVLALSMMILGTGRVSGQEFPHKPIRIVTLGVGGGADFISRLIAPTLAAALGQPMVIDNRGGGIIAPEAVSKAAPDGYTLLVAGGSFWIAPLLQKTPYDPVRDFSAITLISREPNVMVVHPSLPVRSVKDLIALAKARPGELNYSSGPTGTSPHLAGELLKSLARVNIVQIPYKSAAPAISALIGGEVQLTIIGAAAVVPHTKAGRLRALAVSSVKPSALFPGLPTVAATVAGYELVSVTVMAAPANTPAAIIQRLNLETVRIVNQPDVKEKFFSTVQEVVGSSPEELAAIIKSDLVTMGKVIKDAGIKVE